VPPPFGSKVEDRRTVRSRYAKSGVSLAVVPLVELFRKVMKSVRVPECSILNERTPETTFPRFVTREGDVYRNSPAEAKTLSKNQKKR